MVRSKGSKSLVPNEERHFKLLPLLECCVWAALSLRRLAGGNDVSGFFSPQTPPSDRMNAPLKISCDNIFFKDCSNAAQCA
jgi:hypothetical protein